MRGPDRARRTTGEFFPTRKGALKNPCPVCGAKPGWRCVTTKRAGQEPAKPINRPHPGRANPPTGGE